MKRFFIILLCLLLLLLAACESGQSEEEPQAEAPPQSHEIALITSPQGLEDAIVLAAWDGLQAAAAEAELSCRYYQPAGNDYLSAIRQAVENGAKLLVCPSHLQSAAVYQAQKEYPDLSFLTVDHLPTAADTREVRLGENTHALLFSEEEAGFLAGYAAVQDGYSRLGFAAPRDDLAYGLGFLQGLDAAAAELGIRVELLYGYTDELPAGRSVLSLVYPWYIDGTEIIFACSRNVIKPTQMAAEASCAAIIGANTDQHALSDTFVLSAVKDIQGAVYSAAAAYADGSFPGGTSTIGSLAEGRVYLPMENSRLQNFSQEDYEGLLARLAKGELEIIRYEDRETDLQNISHSAVDLHFMD